MIRGLVVWVIWKERNRLIFQEDIYKSATSLGGKIIALIKY
jgi:hypothetical protein